MSQDGPTLLRKGEVNRLNSCRGLEMYIIAQYTSVRLSSCDDKKHVVIIYGGFGLLYCGRTIACGGNTGTETDGNSRTVTSSCPQLYCPM